MIEVAISKAVVQFVGQKNPTNSLTSFRSIDISRKASLEQAGCLFHNNYGRGLMYDIGDRTNPRTDRIAIAQNQTDINGKHNLLGIIIEIQKDK
jgi:hypothetical protein